MRLVRPLLTTAALTAVMLAGCSSRPTDPTTAAAPPAGQPASPAAADAGDPATSPTPTTPTTPTKPNGSGEAARAVATARAFLASQLGMTNLVAGPFRSTGAATGEVGFRHTFGEGRRLLPQTGPYAVLVWLQRLPAGWWVLGGQGRSIQITSPARLQRISSPLSVRGSAEVYEGSLYFKVTRTGPAATCCSARAWSTAAPAPSPATSAHSASASPPALGPAG